MIKNFFCKEFVFHQNSKFVVFDLRCVLIFLCLLFCVAGFVSCSFRTSDAFDDSCNLDKKTYFAVSGSAVLSGAIPAAVSKASTFEARTAVPSISSKITYSVTAANKDDGLKISSVEVGLDKNFSLSLYAGAWTLTASAYYTSDTAKTSVLTGSTSVTVASSDISDVSIEVAPSKSKTGTVSLPFGFSTKNISYALASWTIDSKSYSKKITNGAVASFDLLPDSTSDNTYTKVPSGAIRVAFVFYDSSDELKYRLQETINVFDGMTTDLWQKNADEKYIDIENNQIYIADDIVASFAQKVYYISSGGSDLDGDGSYLAPFKSIQKAVQMIAAQKNTDTCTINLMGDITASNESEFTSGSLINIADSSNLSLKIKSYPETSRFTIDAASLGRVLYVGSGNSVTVQNVTMKNGKASDARAAGIENGAIISGSGFASLELKDVSILSESESDEDDGYGISVDKSVTLSGTNNFGTIFFYLLNSATIKFASTYSNSESNACFVDVPDSNYIVGAKILEGENISANFKSFTMIKTGWKINSSGLMEKNSIN